MIEETTKSETRETRGHYVCSKLPTIKELGRAPTRNEAQLLNTNYDQVCQAWRALLDTRFKLLGLVPFITVAVIVAFIPKSGSEGHLQGLDALIVGFVGLLATFGLGIYEKRNSELYDDLISRGRRIEAELGLENGVFLGRPKGKWKLFAHTPAICIIYLGAILGWVGVILVFGIWRIGEPPNASPLPVAMPWSIYFPTNHSTLGIDTLRDLAVLARSLSSSQDTILIEGHADSRGSGEYNLRLSEMRAEAVCLVLVQEGVGADRIKITAYGESHPVASSETAEGRLINRRVVIRLERALARRELRQGERPFEGAGAGGRSGASQ